MSQARQQIRQQKRNIAALAALALCLAAPSVLARAPDTSLRPAPRLAAPAQQDPSEALAQDALAALAATPEVAAPPAPVRVFYNASQRPAPRPQGGLLPRAKAAAKLQPVSAQAIALSLRPPARPSGLKATRKEAKPAVVQAAATVRTPVPQVAINSNIGAVCGSKEIRGRKLAPIPGRINGCGIADPVQVFEVSGVRLSNPARMDCTTAKALNSWTKDAVKPTIGRLGGGISEYRVAAGYACRTRNNQPGGKISEHGKGRAIDISGFTLKNGQTITVLQGWNRKTEGKVLRSLHKSACKPFGTVLGPNSDRFHRDHFHLDTARYRNGSYCR
ncbi:extensin family protein [Pseudoruegeria sp. SHC-113]|uniref:extensin-like domain-containing protein n=1 Tax=Pseudoruegeria sp. SHC-113 TaxID=2855439 RepID=UPI0021BB009C|nr:extensin family protein [Pseudoruegeria sp. SHC-113]MCT8159726.1 extensin family protein [Pseudoruegeria sp. SHC-113]